MAGSRLAVVIPARNEAATVGAVVAGVKRFGHVIVVDDGSSDGTAGVASSAGAHVVRHDHPRGYDGALSSGFVLADRLGCSRVITMDADGQHSPESAGRFAELLDSGNDLVLGVRPRPARVSEALFGLYTRAAFGVRDPLCGMKGYDLALYAGLGHFDCYRSVGTELMLYGLRHHARVAQSPVPIAPRLGRSGFGGVVRGNARILRALLLGLACRG